VETDVIRSNGGLVVTRSVHSWLTGRREPILALSLDSSDPRVLFSFLGADLSLSPEGGVEGGHGTCRMSNDVENTVTACAPVLDEASGEIREYRKTPSTFHTGKHFPHRIGQLAAHHGDEKIWGVWPRKTIVIQAGSREGGSNVQYGHSDGMQFPPLHRLEEARPVASEDTGVSSVLNGTLGLKELAALSFLDAGEAETSTGMEREEVVMADPASVSEDQLSVFLSKFVLPLWFRFQETVSLRGIRLLKFNLSPLTFSPQRPDASGFSMLGLGEGGREGLFNLTDLQTMPSFLSTPQFHGENQGGTRGEGDGWGRNRWEGKVTRERRVPRHLSLYILAPSILHTVGHERTSVFLVPTPGPSPPRPSLPIAFFQDTPPCESFPVWPASGCRRSGRGRPPEEATWRWSPTPVRTRQRNAQAGGRGD